LRTVGSLRQHIADESKLVLIGLIELRCQLSGSNEISIDLDQIAFEVSDGMQPPENEAMPIEKLDQIG
jgi:hypothetical protein